MFTWICPQCGREVPPSYDECPDCAAAQKQKAAQPVEAAPAPVTPPPAPPQAAVPAPQPPPPPAVHPPPSGQGLPTWLMSILFALAFIGLGLGIYWAIQHFHGSSSAAANPPVALENVPAGAAKGEPHPLQKYIEVTGVRLLQDARKRTEARFLVVNHSGADIADLAGNVAIWGRTVKSDEEAVGRFSFKLPSLGAYEAKEMSAVVDTKLKVYELPDWQNVTAEVQVTAP